MHANSSPAPVDSQSQSGSEDGEPYVVEGIVTPELLFTENDTNFERLYGGTNPTPYVKDAFHDHIIRSHRPPLSTPSTTPSEGNFKTDGSSDGNDSDDSEETDRARTPTDHDYAPHHQQLPHDPRHFVNPEKKGTKAGMHYEFKNVPGNGGCCVVRLKLTPKTVEEDNSILDEESYDCVIEERRMDSDEFYSRFNSGALTDDLRNIMRQALSGMLW